MITLAAVVSLIVSYYSKHIYFGGQWCPEEKLNEIINLYSDRQRCTVMRNDAILSLSLLPQDSSGVNLPDSLPWTDSIKRSVLYASPLVTAALFLWCHSPCWRALGCFISFMCVGHLNLNLCVYGSQTASPSFAFASQCQLSVAYKSPASLAALGTVGPLCADPQLSARLPCWVWETSPWECGRVRVYVCS